MAVIYTPYNDIIELIQCIQKKVTCVTVIRGTLMS